MKIIITGALGHIGSYLVRNLFSSVKADLCILADNFSSERYCSLYNLRKNNLKFHEINLANEEIPFKKADVIIHLAAKTNAAQSAKFKKEFFSNNFQSTKNVVNYCINNNTKLIFASTTSVYGPQKNTVDENCGIKDLNPQSPYAKVKLKEENYIKNQLSKIRNSFLILRLGTVYGYSQGMRFHTAVNKFCLQAALGKPLTIWKTAYNQVRPYLGLDDLNRTLQYILKENLFNNETYNIVSSNLTVKQVVKLIEENIMIKKHFVEHEIMNQLSYNVLNYKFQNTGFKFKSNISKSIKEILSNLKNI